MNVQTADFQGKIVRYSIISDNGILFNTTDVCRVLEIADHSGTSIFRNSSMNMAEIIKTALIENRNKMEFVEWLEKNFVGYEFETPVDLTCDNDWDVASSK